MARLRTFLVFLTVIAMYLCKYIESRVRVHDFSRARRRTMKLPFLRCGYVWATLFTAFYLCIAWGQPSFTRISENGCFCPAEKIVYQCTTVGSGTTRYVVTGCNREQLILLHSEFSDKGASGDCYNSTLGLNATAQSIRTDGTSYWSNLTVTVPNVTIIIQCLHENGTHPDPVGEPVTLIPAVPHEVGNITYTKSESSLRLSWNDSSPPGCPVAYLITSTNCGMCPSTTVATDVNCPDEQAGAEGNCSFSVRMRVCGVIGIPRSINISHGSTSTVTPPITSGNAPSNGVTSSVTIAIAVCVTIAVIAIGVLIAVVIIVCVVKKVRPQVKRKPENNGEDQQLLDEQQHKQLSDVVKQEFEKFRSNFQDEMDKMRREIVERNQEIVQSKQIIRENDSKIRQNEKELERVKKERDDKAAEVVALSTENDKLRAANIKLQKQVFQLESTLECHKKDIADLQSELEKLNNEKASLTDFRKLEQQMKAMQQQYPYSSRNHNEPQDQKREVLFNLEKDVVAYASQVASEKANTYENGSGRDHLQDVSPTNDTISDDNRDLSGEVTL